MLNTEQILKLRGAPPPKEPGWHKRRQGAETEGRVERFFLDNPAWHDYKSISEATGLDVGYIPQIVRRFHLAGFLIRKEVKRGKKSRAAVYRAARYEQRS